MNLMITVEWKVEYAEGMMRWCRENRVPVLEFWSIPEYDLDGHHIGEGKQYLGTRGLYSTRYTERTGSFPFEPGETLCYNFIIRARDYPLWKLRFHVTGDRMHIDNNELSIKMAPV